MKIKFKLSMGKKKNFLLLKRNKWNGNKEWRIDSPIHHHTTTEQIHQKVWQFQYWLLH